MRVLVLGQVLPQLLHELLRERLVVALLLRRDPRLLVKRGVGVVLLEEVGGRDGRGLPLLEGLQLVVELVALLLARCLSLRSC